MSALKKPAICDSCQSNSFTHRFKPERWTCTKCDHVQITRSQRNDPNKCRDCGAKRNEKEFVVRGNICLECRYSYNRRYYEANKKRIRQWHYNDRRRRPEIKQANIRKAIQRSPKAFIRGLMRNITRKCNYYRKAKHSEPDARLDVKIDFDYLWVLYEQQQGLCILSKLPMTHQLNNLRSISVDRIDPEQGYISDNIQLVCKWVNLAKNRHSNGEFIELMVNVCHAFSLQTTAR